MQDYLIQIITGLCTTALVALLVSIWRINIRVGKIPDAVKRLEEIQVMVEELHEWHNHSDADGVKVWWVRRSLEQVIKELTQAVNELSRANANSMSNTQSIANVLDRVTARMDSGKNK